MDTKERDRFILRLWEQNYSLAQIREAMKREGYKPLSREGIRLVIRRLTQKRV